MPDCKVDIDFNTVQGTTNALVEFEARYVLNGSFGGSVVFADPEKDLIFECVDLCAPIKASLSVTNNVTDAYLFPPSQLNSKVWVAGVVLSQEESFSGVDSTNLTVASYFNHLGEKPIYTQQFNYELLTNVIQIVSNFYAGIPVSLRTYNVSNTRIRGPVQGNSIMDELRQLAQAGYAHLFVQVGGQLVMDPWKDHTYPPELTIPEEYIFDIGKAPYQFHNVNSVRVRGAEVPRTICGIQPLSDSRVSDNTGGVSSIPGSSDKIAISGVPTPKMSSTFQNLSANQGDLKNAEVLADGADFKGKRQVEDGSFKSDMRKNNGSFFDSNPHTVTTLVVGDRKEDAEFRSGPQNNPVLERQQRKLANQHERQSRASMDQGYPIPWGSFGNSFGTSTPPGMNMTYDVEQPSFSNIETFALNPWLSNCGMKSEEISNKYVLSKERLFSIAIRRYQELKMEASTWNVELPYIPALRLNQVVRLEVPQKFDVVPREVIGVIAGIDLSHSAEAAETTMKVAIWSTDCLGNDVYVSGNLLQIGCAGEDSLVGNPFETSNTTTDAHSGMDGGQLWLYSQGSFLSFVELLHDEMTVGDMYTLSFEYETFGTVTPGLFSYGVNSTPISGTGTFNQSFASTGTSMILRWQLVSPTPCYMRFSNIILTKTVIA
jgi:hypothetical protein